MAPSGIVGLAIRPLARCGQRIDPVSVRPDGGARLPDERSGGNGAAIAVSSCDDHTNASTPRYVHGRAHSATERVSPYERDSRIFHFGSAGGGPR